MKKIVLTIAGADPSGGAGIQRDIKTFRDYGLVGLSVITALTAQSQKRVKAVFPVPAGMKKVSNPEDMKQAAIKIKGLGPLFVLIKGGHLKAVRSQESGVRRKSEKAIDILYDGREFKTFFAPKIDKEMHGTGCILSSAIAAGMAKGLNVYDAVKRAKAYTTKTIKEFWN